MAGRVVWLAIMAIRIEHVGEIAVVTAEGSFRGGKETDDLRSTLTKVTIDEKQPTVLDMSRVQLMTSFAVGIVIVTHTQAEQLRVDFALCGIQRRISSMLQITSRFGPSLRIFATREEAVSALEHARSDETS